MNICQFSNSDIIEENDNISFHVLNFQFSHLN